MIAQVQNKRAAHIEPDPYEPRGGRRENPDPDRKENEQQKSDVAHVDRHAGRKEHAAEKKHGDRKRKPVDRKRREPTGVEAGPILWKRRRVRVAAGEKEPVGPYDE